MEDGVAVGVVEVFDDAAALHDEAHALHDGDVGEGIALDDNDVSVTARLDCACIFIFFEYGGRVNSMRDRDIAMRASVW